MNIKLATLRMRKWRKKNPEKQREADRRYRERHPEKCRIKQRVWYRNNRAYALNQNRLWHQKNKKKVRIRARLKKHRMTQQEHDHLLRKQKNRCAICREKFRKTPHIDHSHKTGRNRGLLCDDCNLGLGRFKDNVKSLKRAIKYVLKGLVWL